MRLIRAALLSLGLIPIGIGLYGLWSYYPTETLVQLGKWLAVGVVLHDGVLVPLTLLVGGLIWWASRRLPAAVGRIVVGGLMLAAVVSLVAAPAIRRQNVPAANPTVLTQDYAGNLTWLLVAIGTVTVLLALGAWLLQRQSRRNRPNSVDQVASNRLDTR
ncbi:MAG: hypothetical protein ACRDPW_05600 [Mycobacteriales bacterium]